MAASPQVKKRGAAGAAGCVEGLHRFAQGATAPAALKVADCLSGNAYKVSVTGFTVSTIWHDKHSADWLAALASPFPAAPDFRLFRGQNKTPQNTLFISGSTVSTGYSAPACGGKVVAPATKGGNTGMVHEVYDYDSLFFSSDPSFPLEGKSREAGKGVRG